MLEQEQGRLRMSVSLVSIRWLSLRVLASATRVNRIIRASGCLRAHLRARSIRVIPLGRRDRAAAMGLPPARSVRKSGRRSLWAAVAAAQLGTISFVTELFPHGRRSAA